MEILNQYRTENSSFSRIKLTRRNLIDVLDILINIGIKVDQFLLEELKEEEKIEPTLKRYSAYDWINYISKNAEVYIIFQKKYFYVIFISLEGTKLLGKYTEKLFYCFK